MWIVQTIDPVIIDHAQLIVHEEFPCSRELWTRTCAEHTVQTVAGVHDSAGIQRIDFIDGVAFDCKKPTCGFRTLASSQQNVPVKRETAAQTFKLHSLYSSPSLGAAQWLRYPLMVVVETYGEAHPHPQN